MKKLLLLTIMCLFGLSASLKAQCLPPQNVKAKTELNAPGYDKKYKITCTWDAVDGAQGYAVYVSTQYYPDGMWMGNVTTTEFVMGSAVEGQLYFSVITICDADNGIVSDRSEEVSVILSEDIQLNYDVVVSVNPENAGTVTGDGYYDVNDIVTLTASANAGYKFVSWTEDGNVVSTESKYIFTFTTQRELVANFEEKEEDTVETEFVSKEPQKRNVLIEELTGRNCGSCPDGHIVANNLVNNNPGRVWAVNIHSGGYAPTTSYPNLRTTAGDAICSAFSIGQFPAGIVNRSTIEANTQSYWTSYTNQQLNQNAECNIGGQIIINDESRIATATVEVYYTGNSTSENNYLTIMMLQDSIIGDQNGASYNPSQMIGDKYVHMHILRDVITPTWGEKIAPTTAGTLITKTYTYEIPKVIGSPNGVNVDLNNIHFIAFVTEKQDNDNFTGYDIPTRPILNVNQLSIVQAKDVNITATVNPENTGVVKGAGTYKENGIITLTATANEGYRFLNWTEDGNVVSNEAKYLFMATKDRNLVANFIATEGIDELSSAFNLYPNPANDRLYIETQTLTQTLTVEIYDVYGRSQQSTVNSQRSLSIDVSNFNSGIYFVKIVTDNGEVVKRFVKK